MATIIGAGQRYDRIIGVGGVTVSSDGYLWSSESTITEPFPPRMKAQGVAINGGANAFVAISDNGYAAYSTDLQSWSNVRLLDADYSALGVSWGDNGGTRPIFAIAGTRKYNDDNILPGEYADNDQIAQILINETGQTTDWEQAFTHPESSSFFYNVKWFSNVLVNGVSTSVWIAVGQTNGQPDAWYTESVNWTYGVYNVTVTSNGSAYNNAAVAFTSPTGVDAEAEAIIDFAGTISAITVTNPGSRYDTIPNVIITGDGFGATAVATIAANGPPDPYTWQRMTMDDAFVDRPIYDVVQYDGTLYFSGRGMIVSCTDLGNPDWATSDFLTSSDARQDYVSLAVNPSGHLVATSSGSIAYSRDRVQWDQFTSKGYFFRSAAWFNDHWIVGCYSNLTQYTYFTSSDTINWRPRNNLVQMYGMASY